MRLHKALGKQKIHSQLIVRHRFGNELGVVKLEPKDEQASVSLQATDALIERWQTFTKDTDGTLFAWTLGGFDITSSEIFKKADVIHMHWTTAMLSIGSIEAILQSGKPVIWTLHDMNAFTGGCHYSMSCQGYTEDCQNCPQLDSLLHIPPQILAANRQLYAKYKNLHIVTPSNWLQKEAVRSKCFTQKQVRTIPNGVNLEIFTPERRAAAREKYNLLNHEIVLLIGAQNLAERRKGYSLLYKALFKLSKEAKDIDLSKIAIASLGEADEQIKSLSFKTITLGRLDDEAEVADAFAAADIFALPSLQDNLPNTAIESIACGTPVLAFPSGGIPEIITHGETGWITSEITADALYAKLRDCLANSEKMQQLRPQCREQSLQRYSSEIYSKNYINMYRELSSADQSGPNTPQSSDQLCSFTVHHPDMALSLLQRITSDMKHSLEEVEANLNQTSAKLEQQTIALAQTQSALKKSEAFKKEITSSIVWKVVLPLIKLKRKFKPQL